MRAVLWDMDGTLVDSEKLWDISLAALYERHGGELTPEVRTALVGSSAENTIRTVFADLGLDPDPAAMAEADRWLHDYTAELFEQGLMWRDGARELLESLAAEDIPMALVTNTQRALTERALRTIGREFFAATVCGDEVARGKPAPDPYRRAAELLDLPAAACLAVEDSVTGVAAAESAGCPVLVVPHHVEVPPGPLRFHIGSLAEVMVDDLRRIHARLHARVHRNGSG
ncbi:HAD hydrolase, IA, variant 1 family protein [Mycolicibacterium hassiacum DSM 44199]|jgi:HAD superfamily hydrolase (TIGR01509 family)|uniref:HAD hydrolase, IA, variant 1 family protein n=1 Tax=Mycolicibacterium hassiacum (strain DSM 44199 / CIP 105218 / JCM 12690 / 3849) TaxID=1122247 RepID=K5BB79_MYCHD|nr:HAD family phosphatase [Mycolicibacterium hassiacum]EKF23520.1 HAD hydrolase, IA, variant 1 family protein [Mycolicibacterium hassiacum DSM 44199]MDA4084659.1 HAD family hydrolase [Mycolicibacterium hassiacum DSM 44199]PZN17992.1 MAG: HAD family phosphatase [Mycolicibacterium hassiacum]VCT89881.1 Phosphorylated carbohydrates phosphatase [Mycolicibacterium hassiacum DSM 44199]